MSGLLHAKRQSSSKRSQVWGRRSVGDIRRCRAAIYQSGRTCQTAPGGLKAAGLDPQVENCSVGRGIVGVSADTLGSQALKPAYPHGRRSRRELPQPVALARQT